MDGISFRKPFHRIVLVFPNTFQKVAGHPDIQSAVPFARQNIYAGNLLIHMVSPFKAWLDSQGLAKTDNIITLSITSVSARSLRPACPANAGVAAQGSVSVVSDRLSLWIASRSLAKTTLHPCVSLRLREEFRLREPMAVQDFS